MTKILLSEPTCSSWHHFSQSQYGPEAFKVSALACEFSVLTDPSMLEKLKLLPVDKTNLFVVIDEGILSFTTFQGSHTEINVDDVVAAAVTGKKNAILVRNRHHLSKRTRHQEIATKIRFDHRLGALEFCATVHLMQHISYLKRFAGFDRVKNVVLVNNDLMLSTQVKNTLDYAKAMWKYGLWKELWPYCGIIESLQKISALISDGHIESLNMADAILTKLYEQFNAQSTINFMMEQNGIRYYRGSYITTLVSKLCAVRHHLAYYV